MVCLTRSPFSRCPRFILHYHGQSKHRPSSTPSCWPLSQSYSMTPLTLTLSSAPHPHNLPSSHLPSHCHTPSQTPTFRRVGGRARSKSSSMKYCKEQMREVTKKEIHNGYFSSPSSKRTQSENEFAVADLLGNVGINRVYEGSIAQEYHPDEEWRRPRTAPEFDLPVTGSGLVDGTTTLTGRSSRKIWALSSSSTHLPSQEQTTKVGGKKREKVSASSQWDLRERRPRKSKGEEGRSSAALHGQLAKYTQHYLPDVNSRCASAVVSARNHNNSQTDM